MTPIDTLMNGLSWSPTNMKPDNNELPFATHEGVLEVAGLKLRCYRLNTGEAIINSDNFMDFFSGIAE
jgi:hypothetical protein